MAVKKKKKKEVSLGQSKLKGQSYDPTTKEPLAEPKPAPQPKRYNIGGREVSEEEYKKELAGRKIVAEGGRDVKAEMKKRAEAEEVAAPQLEEAGAFEEVTPEEVSLQEGTFVPPVPIGGPAGAGVVQGILQNPRIKEWMASQVGLRTLAVSAITPEEAFPTLTDETLREAALREIRKESYKKGISSRETFGAFVEAIPLFGSLVSRYVGGLVEAPYSNAMSVLDEINKIKEAASTGQEKVRNGLEDPDYGLGRAREMEEDISKLEGRIKLLKETSAILQANTDEVNKIQEQILETREKIARYRQASEFGLTASLTGTGRVIPTDEQIYFELKDMKGGKENG